MDDAEAVEPDPAHEVAQVAAGGLARAAGGDHAHGEGVALGEHPGVGPRDRPPVQVHPVRPLPRVRAGLELQLQAEVHPRQPDADLAGQPRRRAVGRDDDRCAQGTVVGLDDVVGHRHHAAGHPHLRTGRDRLGEQPRVELGPGDHLQAGRVHGAGTTPSARQRERDPGDRRPSRRCPRQRGERRPDQPSAAGLVARERRPVEHDDARAGRRGRPGRGRPGRPRADHRDVVLLHGADARRRSAREPDRSSQLERCERSERLRAEPAQRSERPSRVRAEARGGKVRRPS